MNHLPEKKVVYDFWNVASCGEKLYLNSNTAIGYQQQKKIRYELEPYILPFADFAKWKNRKVLEIGIGLGADHQQFAEAGAHLFGIDLTENAIKHGINRFKLLGLNSTLDVADAECLPFENETFDLVYSWGVLHHTPNTSKAFEEVWRVLKPGGTAKIMIYHKYSVVGFMLWVRYGLLALKPWRSLTSIYNHYLESPGTKAYSKKEASGLMRKFSDFQIKTVLSHGDLLTSAAGQRHRGWMLSLAKYLWPRWLIRKCLPKYGLFMLIDATK